MEPRIRAFLAANVSITCARAAAALATSFRREIEPLGLRVAWVHPANLHLTLKFLGSIQAELIEAMQARLARELVSRAPIEVRVGGVGAFPSPAEPRVLWVGIEEPTGALAALARDVDGWMSDLGFIREERPFRPHLTVGRVKEGNASVQEAVAKLERESCGVSVLDELCIYESKTRAAGAEYGVRARVGFGGASRRRSEEVDERPRTGQ